MKYLINRFLLLFVLTVVIAQFSCQAQQNKVRTACIAFYNVENLFDTIDSPDTDDSEFLPDGANRWSGKRYLAKLDKLSEVISKIGNELVHQGPTLIGLSEIENRQVMEDLIKTPALRNLGYGIIHFDSPDGRGVDVGLLYKKSAFRPESTTSVRLSVPWNEKWKTRDQLVVSGKLDGDRIHIIVNHWPSRRSGPEYRAEAGKLSRKIVDSLYKIDPEAKIILMGDLNDDPIDPSVTEHLSAKGKEKELKGNDLFNPYFQLFKEGVGSLAYRDAWNLFDQIIISQALLGKDRKSYKYYKARVFNERFLFQKDGQYAGYPWRTFAGGSYAGGYSDHLPVYLFLVKDL